MLFINYTLADEKYISAPLLPLSSRPPHTAPSRFRPQEPEWRPEEYSFAFQLPFWLGSEALLLTHSQSIFPLYLMKYTGFSNPDGVFLVLLSGFLLFFFFNFLCFRPGILFTASDRSCDGPGGAIPAPKLLHLPPSLLLQLHAWVPGPEDLSQARRTDEVRKVHCGSLY